MVAAAETTRPLVVRAVLNDPVNPGVVFQIRTRGEALNQLQLMNEAVPQPVTIDFAGDTLSLYGEKVIGDAKVPPVLAAAQIPASVQRCMLVITPAPKGAKLPYQMVAFNDSPQAFPFGESRILNTTIVPMAMEAGSSKVSVPPGAFVAIKSVKDVNQFKMAQTNFYMKSGESWLPVSERQIQYLDTMRRIFIVYVTPGSTSAMVRTIIDHEPPKIDPKAEKAAGT